MDYKYNITTDSVCYDGFFKLLKYRIDYSGFQNKQFSNVIRECGHKGDVAVILPFDPVKKKIILVEQFRIGPAVRGEHPWSLEVVAGFVDNEDKTPENTAIREVKEETGCDVKKITAALEYYSGPGGSAGKSYYFIAEVDSSEYKPYTGVVLEDEDIRVHCLDIIDVKAMLDNKTIDNATTLIALQYFFSYYQP